MFSAACPARRDRASLHWSPCCNARSFLWIATADEMVTAIRKVIRGHGITQFVKGLVRLPPFRLAFAALFLIAVPGAGIADPKNPRRWDCLRRLVMALPAANPEGDPLYWSFGCAVLIDHDHGGSDE
jgi:hypothetical protein